MQFFKLFIAWAVLFFLLFVVLFWGSEGGVKTLFFGASIFVVPLSVIITFVHKWIIEARFKTSTNANLTKNELITQSSISLMKWIGIFVLLVLSGLLYPPIPFYAVFFYLAKKIVDVTKAVLSSIPWFVTATAHVALFYFVCKYGVALVASMVGGVQGLDSEPFRIIAFGIGDLFILEQYLVVFIPVIFYEWRNAAIESHLTSIRQFIFGLSFDFILISVLTLIRLAYDFYVFTQSSREAIGWGVMGLMILVPLGIIVPSIWILFRERASFFNLFPRSGA